MHTTTPPSPQAKPSFGQTFLPEMALAEGNAEHWGSVQVVPFGPQEHSPAWSAIHYGQCAFEGLKAHPHGDGLRLFRPYAHYLRLRSTCERLAMACPPWDLFLRAMRGVLRNAPTLAPVYLRPLVTAQEAFLGVRPAKTYRLLVMACEALPYFAHQGLRLRTETRWARAFPGGTGAVKTPGNYAASLLGSSTAKAEGFDDVLWLDAAEHAYAEEAGAMNVFFRIGDAWHTPELNGSLLPGITRDTVIRLFKANGIPVLERRVALTELGAALEADAICEAFGTGTAAGIAPISELWHEGRLLFKSNPAPSLSDGHQTAWMQQGFQRVLSGDLPAGVAFAHPEDGWVAA
jgi:branched-chain amino acid aminotransferase